MALFTALFVVLSLLWLALFVPVSKSAQPIVAPRIVLLTRDGQPFAEAGPLMDKPVEVRLLPDHVAHAFYAIEDRRFRSHWGIDPRGLARAVINNLLGRGQQGGSTLTQQLAKNVYLIDPVTHKPQPGYFRKVKEALIAFWLEAWLTKDQILERYLSNVAFGQNVYGLRAASLYYFNRQPENLRVQQAVMLAGLVQAPSRLDPSRHLASAERRAAMVAEAMAKAGYLSAADVQALPAAELDLQRRKPMKAGTFFADWAMPVARERAGIGYAEQRIVTTLDGALQRAAQDVTAHGLPSGSEVALVAMRPTGEVVAMIGGRDYAQSQFNRAVQARRQPGSTFKLFTYLTAIEGGMTPSSLVANAAIEDGDYRPANADGYYGSPISLRDAFARSSNVAAVKLFNEVKPEQVIATAHRLGIEDNIEPKPSLALGATELSVLRMTAAYAAIAAGRAPVRALALSSPPRSWLDLLFRRGPKPLDETALAGMRELMARVVTHGTGKAAGLPVPAFGKTGTTQDGRDAWFIGYAGELVVGVWIGNDQGLPIEGISGGGRPAVIWHDFMLRALQLDKLRDRPEAVSGVSGNAARTDTDGLVDKSRTRPGSGANSTGGEPVTAPDGGLPRDSEPAAVPSALPFRGDDLRPILITPPRAAAAGPRDGRSAVPVRTDHAAAPRSGVAAALPGRPGGAVGKGESPAGTPTVRDRASQPTAGSVQSTVAARRPNVRPGAAQPAVAGRASAPAAKSPVPPRAKPPTRTVKRNRDGNTTELNLYDD